MAFWERGVGSGGDATGDGREWLSLLRLVQTRSEGRPGVFESLFRAGDILVINQSRPCLRGSTSQPGEVSE